MIIRFTRKGTLTCASCLGLLVWFWRRWPFLNGWRACRRWCPYCGTFLLTPCIWRAGWGREGRPERVCGSAHKQEASHWNEKKHQQMYKWRWMELHRVFCTGRQLHTNPTWRLAVLVHTWTRNCKVLPFIRFVVLCLLLNHSLLLPLLRFGCELPGTVQPGFELSKSRHGCRGWRARRFSLSF